MQSRVIDLFHQSIEAKMACGELLDQPLAECSTLIANQLLEERKVLCCGTGIAGNLASIFSLNLSLGYKMDRPGFAAITLATDPGHTSAILHKLSVGELFSEQLRALGNPGDILVAFSLGEDNRSIVRAIQCAHEKQMRVVAFYTPGDQSINASLSDSDIPLHIPLTDRHRASEVQLLSIYALCDLIDYQLFGGVD